MSDDNLSRVFPSKNPGDALELFGQRLKLWEPPAWITDEDNVRLRAHHDPRPYVNDNPLDEMWEWIEEHSDELQGSMWADELFTYDRPTPGIACGDGDVRAWNWLRETPPPWWRRLMRRWWG